MWPSLSSSRPSLHTGCSQVIWVAGGTARLGEKTRQTAEFWLAIAELLDVTIACGAEVAATATRVGLGSAALAKFLTVDPQIVRTINHARAQRGLKALR